MKRLNSEQWRAVDDRSDALLLKSLDTEVSLSEKQRILNFVISTEAIDSYNDVIKADGWDLSRYLKNPVVLWAHDSRQPPIGKAVSIGVEEKRLVASAEFADAETYAFADTIYRLLLGKFLRATSVGFFPREWTYDEERGGFNLIKNELFEFSVVPVPANPEALGAAAKSGIDCAPLKEWAEKTLALWRGAEGSDVQIWIPRQQIESIYAGLTPRPVSLSIADTEQVVTERKSDLTIELDEESEEEDVAIEATEAEVSNDRLPEAMAVMSDEIEALKAQVDQLMLRLHDQQKAADEKANEEDDLSAVIDIQFDGADIEDEVSRSIVDLEINPEELQAAIRRQLEHELMRNTGRLPKEV